MIRPPPATTSGRRLGYIVGGVFVATMLALCCAGLNNVNYYELVGIPAAAAMVAYVIGSAVLRRRGG